MNLVLPWQPPVDDIVWFYSDMKCKMYICGKTTTNITYIVYLDIVQLKHETIRHW